MKVSLKRYNRAMRSRLEEDHVKHSVRIMESKTFNNRRVGIDWADSAGMDYGPDMYDFAYDIDSTFLVTHDLNHIESSINLLVMPDFINSVQKKLHIKSPIDVQALNPDYPTPWMPGEDGAEVDDDGRPLFWDSGNSKLGLHRIPNIRIGSIDTRGMVSIFFPGLLHETKGKGPVKLYMVEQFFNGVLYPSLQKVLGQAYGQSVPTSVSTAIRQSKTIEGKLSWIAKVLNKGALQKLVAAMRELLAETRDGELAIYNGFFFATIYRGLKHGINSHTDKNLTAQLKCVAPAVNWQLASTSRTTFSLYVDYGIEIFLRSPEHAKQTTMLWMLPELESFCHGLGAVELKYDRYCNASQVGGVRFRAGYRSLLQRKYGIVYGQCYLNEKGIGYRAARAGREGIVNYHDMCKMNERYEAEHQYFEDVITDSANRSFGVRMEMRMPWCSSRQIERYATQMFKKVVNYSKPLITRQNSHELYELRKMRVRCIEHMARRLNEVLQGVRDAQAQAQCEIFAHYLRYIFYSLLSRPSEYNSTCNNLMDILKVPQLSGKWNVPVCDMLDFNTCKATGSALFYSPIDVVVISGRGGADQDSGDESASDEEEVEEQVLKREIYGYIDSLRDYYSVKVKYTSAWQNIQQAKKRKRALEKQQAREEKEARKRQKQQQKQQREEEERERLLQQQQQQEAEERDRVQELINKDEAVFAKAVIVEFKRNQLDYLSICNNAPELRQRMVEQPWDASLFNSNGLRGQFKLQDGRGDWLQQRFDGYFKTEPITVNRDLRERKPVFLKMRYRAMLNQARECVSDRKWKLIMDALLDEFKQFKHIPAVTFTVASVWPRRERKFILTKND